LTVITIRIDERLKDKMKKIRHVNWSEVIRSAIIERVTIEESMTKRKTIDLELLGRAIADQDRLRTKTNGNWSGAEEVRKWRELRK
jgi:hypothetical protein